MRRLVILIILFCFFDNQNEIGFAQSRNDEQSLEEVIEESKKKLREADEEIRKSREGLEEAFKISNLLDQGATAPGGKRFKACVYNNEIDELTGKSTKIVMTFAYSNEKGLIDKELGVLAWRCQEGEKEIRFVSNIFLDRHGDYSEYVSIQYRFSNEATHTEETWWSGGDYKLAIDNVPKEFTGKAKPASEVLFRVRDHRGKSFTFKFNLMGLTRALQEMSCEW